MSIKTRIDDVREWLQPGYKLRRQNINQLQEISEKSHKRLMESHFEGGDKKDRARGSSWLGSRLSPDSALEEDLEYLREHSDELYRNFGFITGAIDHRTENVIGRGLRPKASIPVIEGVISKEDAESWNAQLDEAWTQWQAKAGRSGRQTFAEACRLAHREWRRGGDSFVIFSDSEVEGRPITLQVNVVGPKRVETPPEKIASDNVRMGIEQNEDGDPIAYWVRDSQPNDAKDVRLGYTSFDAGRVCHLFEEKWEGQTRGIPWVSAIINEAKDFKDFREATIIKQQTEACVMMIIATADPKKLAEASRNAQGNQEMSPGRILHTNLEDQVTPFIPGTGAGANFEATSTQMLLGITSGINYPYGWVVRDRRQSSLAAGKLEEMDGRITVLVDFQIIRDRIVAATWDRFVVQCVTQGVVDIPIVLFRKYRAQFQKFNCASIGRGWVDVLKEVQAAVIAKNENIMSLETIGAGLGLDNDETMIRRSLERRRERDSDIEPPSLMVAKAGVAEPANDEKPANSDDNPDGGTAGEQ